ncbi:hypothetical protein HYR99_24925 [Candidatus Poribacteria bacterium]|nr:hypothetical protein [Candidatus Poribacteria bacterium]
MNTNLPGGGSESNVTIEKNHLQVALGLRRGVRQKLQEGSRRIANPRRSHIESLTYTLNLGYGITEKLSISLLLPRVSASVTYLNLPVGNNPPALIHDELVGFQDISLLLRYRLVPKKKRFLPSIVLSGGLTIPVGETFLNSQRVGLFDTTLQLGTGTWDVLSGVEVVYPLSGRLSLASNFLARFPRGSNEFSYHFANSQQYSLGITYQGLNRKLDAVIRIDAIHTGQDRQNGALIPPIGRTAIYFSPSLQFRPTEAVSMALFVRLPVYQYVNSQQMVDEPELSVSSSYIFSLF